MAAGALLTGFGTGATILGLTIGASLQSTFFALGVNMLISGVTDMLTPDPQPFNAERQEDPRDQGFAFSGLLNNSKQGVAINIVYGEMLIGSTIVSSSVDTFQVVNEA